MPPEDGSTSSVRDEQDCKQEEGSIHTLKCRLADENERQPSKEEGCDISHFDAEVVPDSPLSRLLDIHNDDIKDNPEAGFEAPASPKEFDSLSQKRPTLHFETPKLPGDAMTFDIPDFVLDTSSLPMQSAQVDGPGINARKASLGSSTSPFSLDHGPQPSVQQNFDTQGHCGLDGCALISSPPVVFTNGTFTGHVSLQQHQNPFLASQYETTPSSQKAGYTDEGSSSHMAGSAERPKRARSNRVIKFDGLECSLEACLPELTPEEAKANRGFRRQVRRRQRNNKYPQVHSQLFGHGGSFLRSTPRITTHAFDAKSTSHPSEAIGVQTLVEDDEGNGGPDVKKVQRIVKNRASALKSRRHAKEKMNELQQINADLRNTVDQLLHTNGALFAEMGHWRNAAETHTQHQRTSVASHLAALGRANIATEPFQSPTPPVDAAITSQEEKSFTGSHGSETVLPPTTEKTRESENLGNSVADERQQDGAESDLFLKS